MRQKSAWAAMRPATKRNRNKNRKREEKRRGLSIDYSLLEKSLGRENRHVITWDSMMRWRDVPRPQLAQTRSFFLRNCNYTMWMLPTSATSRCATYQMMHLLASAKWYGMQMSLAMQYALAHSCQMMRRLWWQQARQKAMALRAWFFGTVILFCNK